MLIYQRRQPHGKHVWQTMVARSRMGCLCTHNPRRFVPFCATNSVLTPVQLAGGSLPEEPALQASQTHVKAEPSGPAKLLLGSDVEMLLTKDLGQVYNPFARNMLNFVQVLRGVTAACQVWCEKTWPRVVGVLSGDDEQRHQLVDLQWPASMMLVLLQSANHWSVMAVLKKADGTAAAMHYDTLGDRTCRDHGVAILTYLAERKWLPATIELREASVPRQPDAWSCGHSCGHSHG